jgi:hypothetical protein
MISHGSEALSKISAIAIQRNISGFKKPVKTPFPKFPPLEKAHSQMDKRIFNKYLTILCTYCPIIKAYL